MITKNNLFTPDNLFVSDHETKDIKIKNLEKVNLFFKK